MQEEINIGNKDSLTGLWNRLYFMRETNKYLKKNDHKLLSYAYIFFKVDHFHLFNQKFGSICGEQLLVDFSQQILYLVDKENLIGRIDNDIFAIFFKKVRDKNDLLKIALKLRQVFFYVDVPSQNELTCSISLTCYPDDGGNSSYEQTLSALDFASINGINKICFYENGQKTFFQETRSADNKELPIDIFRFLYEGKRNNEDWNQILSLISDYYRADRIYIYKKNEASQCLQCVLSCNNQSFLPELMWDDSIEQTLHSLYQQDVFYSNNMKQMPEIMRKLIIEKRTQVFYQHIIHYHGLFWGFIVLEQYGDSIQWNEEDLYRLKIIIQTLTIFLNLD